MTRRWRITLIIVAVVSLAGIAFWLLRPSEPVHEGRPLSAWLEDLTSTRDGVEHERATEAVRAIGTNAVPHLLRLARYEDSRWRVTLNHWLRELPENLSPSLAQLEERERWNQALAGFLALGPEAKDSVPALTELMMTSERPSMAPLYLQAIGTNGIPALVSALTLSNRANRVSAVMALAKFGPRAESSVPAIVAAIDTNDLSSHTYFVMALGQIGRRPDLAVPALAQALGSASMEVRVWAALMLAEFGPEAESARPALETAAKHPVLQVRDAAKKALDRLNAGR